MKLLSCAGTLFQAPETHHRENQILTLWSLHSSGREADTKSIRIKTERRSPSYWECCQLSASFGNCPWLKGPTLPKVVDSSQCSLYPKIGLYELKRPRSLDPRPPQLESSLQSCLRTLFSLNHSPTSPLYPGLLLSLPAQSQRLFPEESNMKQMSYYDVTLHYIILYCIVILYYIVFVCLIEMQPL